MARTGLARTETFAGLSFALAAAGGSARAQTTPSIDARTWQPSADPATNLVLEPTATPGPWSWNVGAWVQYAQDPVVVRGLGAVESRPIAHLVVTDLVAGIGLGDRASVGIDVPIILWQNGEVSLPSAVVHGGAVPTNGIGDVALLGKVTMVSNDRQGVRGGWGVAGLGSGSLPTGNRASFLSDGAVDVSARVLVEYAVGVGAARASLGYAARTETRTWPASGNVTFGNSLPWAVGAVLRPKALAAALDRDDRQLWEIAAHGSLPAGPMAPFGIRGSGAPALSPVLLAADDRVSLGHDRDAYAVAGAEIGLDHALGVPVFRAVASVGWAPRVHDGDSDGVRDDVDQCPDLPEDRDGIQDTDGCPEDDADGDGTLDDYDACPQAPGPPSEDPTKSGCPVPAPGAPATPSTGTEP